MGGSCGSAHVTALANETEYATTSSAPASASAPGVSTTRTKMGRPERAKRSTNVEEQIDRSKCHWSEVVQSDCDDDEAGAAEIENVEVFRTLQLHPSWGSFFCTFGDGGMNDEGELVIGEKFAGGGQAELVAAPIQWRDPELNAFHLNLGAEWVAKVFKKEHFAIPVAQWIAAIPGRENRNLKIYSTTKVFKVFTRVHKVLMSSTPRDAVGRWKVCVSFGARICRFTYFS